MKVNQNYISSIKSHKTMKRVDLGKKDEAIEGDIYLSSVTLQGKEEDFLSNLLALQSIAVSHSYLSNADTGKELDFSSCQEYSLPEFNPSGFSGSNAGLIAGSPIFEASANKKARERAKAQFQAMGILPPDIHL